MSHKESKPQSAKPKTAAHCAHLCLGRRSAAAGRRPAAHIKPGKPMKQCKQPDKRPALCHRPSAHTCAVQLPRSTAATMTAGLCAALGKAAVTSSVRPDYVLMARSRPPWGDLLAGFRSSTTLNLQMGWAVSTLRSFTAQPVKDRAFCFWYVCAIKRETACLQVSSLSGRPLSQLSQLELSPAGVTMSEARIPRKHKGEVLSQSSEHAKAVRRQPKRRAGIKGRREYDVQAERGQQNVSVAVRVQKLWAVLLNAALAGRYKTVYAFLYTVH